MHGVLRARHSLAMHFSAFAASDVEALNLIVKLEQAKREMGADLRHESEGEGGGEGEEARMVGDWWMEGGMGVIDVGERPSCVSVRRSLTFGESSHPIVVTSCVVY